MNRNRNNNRNNNRYDNKIKAKKECYFCVESVRVVDYKDVILLRRFINTVGKIIPTRRTGTCSKHQRMVSKAIKRARIIGLLPFVAK